MIELKLKTVINYIFTRAIVNYIVIIYVLL